MFARNHGTDSEERYKTGVIYRLIIQFSFNFYRDSSKQQTKQSKMAFKVLIVLSALVAVSIATPTVSGDYGSVGVQTDQTIRVRFWKSTTFLIFQ